MQTLRGDDRPCIEGVKASVLTVPRQCPMLNVEELGSIVTVNCCDGGALNRLRFRERARVLEAYQILEMRTADTDNRG